MDLENDVVYDEPEFEGVFQGLQRILTQLQGFNDGAEDDDEDEPAEDRWDWDAPPPPALIRGGHHHHHHLPRPQFEMFGMIGGESFRGMLLHHMISTQSVH